ncbi:hypothetical protein KW800_02575 [Candidatus Parcubacteria bacterium]|nr:hypothetical protein [Candidatus Parcubacteria bacterium]
MWFRKKDAGPKRLMPRGPKAKKPKSRFRLWMSDLPSRASTRLGKSAASAKIFFAARWAKLVPWLKSKARVPDTGLPVGIIVQGVVAIVVVAILCWKASAATTHTWDSLKAIRWPVLSLAWISGVAVVLMALLLITLVVMRRREAKTAPAPEGRPSASTSGTPPPKKKNAGNALINLAFSLAIVAALVFFGVRFWQIYPEEKQKDRESKERIAIAERDRVVGCKTNAWVDGCSTRPRKFTRMIYASEPTEVIMNPGDKLVWVVDIGRCNDLLTSARMEGEYKIRSFRTRPGVDSLQVTFLLQKTDEPENRKCGKTPTTDMS